MMISKIYCGSNSWLLHHHSHCLGVRPPAPGTALCHFVETFARFRLAGPRLENDRELADEKRVHARLLPAARQILRNSVNSPDKSHRMKNGIDLTSVQVRLMIVQTTTIGATARRKLRITHRGISSTLIISEFLMGKAPSSQRENRTVHAR